jgi:hypothetical protein
MGKNANVQKCKIKTPKRQISKGGKDANGLTQRIVLVYVIRKLKVK